MSEKVKLPKDIYDDLDKLNTERDYPIRYVTDMFAGSVDTSYPFLSQYFNSDRSRRITKIMQALINGYEVEQTPEDKIFEKFHMLLKYEDRESDYMAQGIKWTLQTLGKELLGVTDCEINTFVGANG